MQREHCNVIEFIIKFVKLYFCDNCKNILIELNIKYKNFEKYFIEIIRTYMYTYQCVSARWNIINTIISYIIFSYMVFNRTETRF